MFQKLAQEEKKIAEQINNAIGREPKVQEEKQEDENSWLDYFSTHPQGEDRINLLQAMANEQTGKSFTPLLPQVDWKKLMHSVKAKEQK
jgi:Zn-dependent protease with chaperone function